MTYCNIKNSVIYYIQIKKYSNPIEVGRKKENMKKKDGIKNTNAIDKIIAELAMKDYMRVNPANRPLRKDGTKKYTPYILSPETNEAREIKINYMNGSINEEEYKAYCLKYNLGLL